MRADAREDRSIVLFAREGSANRSVAPQADGTFSQRPIQGLLFWLFHVGVQSQFRYSLMA